MQLVFMTGVCTKAHWAHFRREKNIFANKLKTFANKRVTSANKRVTFEN